MEKNTLVLLGRQGRNFFHFQSHFVALRLKCCIAVKKTKGYRKKQIGNYNLLGAAPFCPSLRERSNRGITKSPTYFQGMVRITVMFTSPVIPATWQKSKCQKTERLIESRVHPGDPVERFVGLALTESKVIPLGKEQILETNLITRQSNHDVENRPG
jgi:hypothetical protein